jgi:hypothetical protein
MWKAILDTRVLIAEDLGAAPAPLVLAHPKLHCSAEGCASLPDWLGVRPRLLIYDGVTSRGATTPCAGRRWLEVSYVPDDGAEHRVPLAQARAVPLEQGLPVRRFTSRKGQRHLSGLRWSATTSGHAGFESWLAHDHVLPLDFDPSVLGIASQPFWLH